jgi:peptidoglycan/LPS O-acetylase OafA/YrhL
MSPLPGTKAGDPTGHDQVTAEGNVVSGSGRHIASNAERPRLEPEKSKPRSVGLDVMRFIAVMMVLYAHGTFFDSTKNFFNRAPYQIHALLKASREGAWVCVDLFFVLSGFLISGLLFKELKKTGTVFIGRFLIRRGFKIYPAFWLMILVTVVGFWIQGSPVSLKTLISELLFIQNYLPGPAPTYTSGFWGPTWSLAVEEHFYFMLAGFFYFLKKRSTERGLNIQAIPKLFFWVAGGCLVARVITNLLIPLYTPATRFWFQSVTHVRMDSIFFGVLISYYWHNCWDESFKDRLLSKRWLFAVAGVVLLLPGMFITEPWARVVGFNCIYVGAGYLLLSLLSLDRSPANACVRLMAWLGKHSYSVYLWHMMAGFWLLPYIVLHSRNMAAWTANLLIYITLCWVVGVVMSELVEAPVLRVRDRFFPWLRNARMN